MSNYNRAKHSAKKTTTKSTKHKSKRNTKKLRSRLLLFILIMIIVIGLYKMFKKDKLEGTWSYDDVTVYEFDGKGKGSLILPSSQYAFKYQLKKNKIHLDFESERAKDSDYEYSIEGDQLTIKGIKATAGTYILHKK